jgi:hypothetical protein
MARRPFEVRDIGTSYIVGLAVYRSIDKAPQIYLAHVSDSSEI